MICKRPYFGFHTSLVTACMMVFNAGLGPILADENFDICKQQMLQMGEAIAAYRQDHAGQFPAELGDLYGRYLSNPAVLKCPAALAAGIAGQRDPTLLELSEKDGAVIGYNWEMIWEDPEFWEGQGWGMKFRDFKRMQLESLIGDHMPVLRCSHHTNIKENLKLNLTADGRIYESEDYWECNFVDTLPAYRLAPEMVHMAGTPMSQLVRPRPLHATDDMIDLRSYYNARFEDPWIRTNPGEEWTAFGISLTGGVLRSNELSFDPAGIIQLNGRIDPGGLNGFSRLKFPTNVNKILINRPFRIMNVIGAVVYPSEIGKIVARITFYSGDDEAIDEWDWKYGIDVSQATAPQAAATARSGALKPAWEGRFRLSDYRGEKAQLFHLRYRRTQSTVPVKYIRFSTGETFSAPLISAITLEQ